MYIFIADKKSLLNDAQLYTQPKRNAYSTVSKTIAN